MNYRVLLPSVIGLVLALGSLSAEDHRHDHGGPEKSVEPPRIFLDKSLRVVQYQLNRLDNERLLLVERKTDDPKYAPVYAAILTRAGMSPQYREEALSGLVELRESTAARELLNVLEAIDPDDRQERRTARQLASLLLRQQQDVLKSHAGALHAATGSDNSLLRSIGYAGLVVAGESTAAWSAARGKESATLDWLAAVSLVPKPGLRSGLREQVAGLIDVAQPTNIRRAAIQAIASVPGGQAETFQLIAPLAADAKLRAAAVRTLLTIPVKQRDPGTSRALVDLLVRHAEETPAEKRTTDDFIDGMQLADQLLARIPVDAARSYRDRLRSITVRVVRIRTVAEEMRYDTPYFAVQAGRPVQVILENEDLMPHNLVVVVPGALKEVAELGLAAGPTGYQGKEYVPESDKVLYATNMVQSGKQERLTFTAPSEPGEFPYVCTFPRHWMRMYGVMVVVDDLDVWLQDPTEPKDPIGSNRAFVKAWSIDDFQGDLGAELRGRTAEIGQRLFAEATCAQCHKVKGKGGAVGPELTDVFQRWKGDRKAVLREILDPSQRIDPKFAVRVVVTRQGRVISGIVTAENKNSVSLLENPEASEPAVIPRADIAEMVKTSTSMMPRALLDRFTKDEIFEMMAFLEASGRDN
ncbi:MAG: plastocyanin/azurin family copper-binding protein [Planctomycetota bacterium]|nr:plastocyanin/azurin family copper-binding protein [Planctomycetota bacterium]